MRTLALDVGDRRIGIAVSDALGITAQGLETYYRTESSRKDAAYIVTLLEQYKPCRLLMGLPMNMNGTIGEQGEKVQKFADVIRKEWDGENIPDVASWVVPHSVGPRFPGPPSSEPFLPS